MSVPGAPTRAMSVRGGLELGAFAGHGPGGLAALAERDVQRAAVVHHRGGGLGGGAGTGGAWLLALAVAGELGAEIAVDGEQRVKDLLDGQADVAEVLGGRGLVSLGARRRREGGGGFADRIGGGHLAVSSGL